MSLKLRINLLFGLLLALGLGVAIGHMMIKARARSLNESAAMTQVTRDFLEAALIARPVGEETPTALKALAARLDGLRHIRVAFVQGSAAPQDLFDASPARARAPKWFLALVGAPQSVTVLPVLVAERRIGALEILSDPSDEIEEVWSDARDLALIGVLVGVIALVGANVLLARTLKPLSDCGDLLGRLRDGEFSARILPRGAVEFVDLCEKANQLAEALAKLSDDNRALIQRMMAVQEDERRRIAHELHDEIGPYLFALRANATVIEAFLRARQDDAETAQIWARSLDLRAQIEALQSQNRRILRQLRPPALDDLGLAEALAILVEGWRERQPEVDIDLRLPDRLTIKDEATTLALYRIVQEALTNIFRHAEASRASVVVTLDDAGQNIRLRVQDDGVGLADDRAAGLGLTGMRERALGLGGEFAFGAAPGGGSRLDVALPLGSAKFEQTLAP